MPTPQGTKSRQRPVVVGRRAGSSAKREVFTFRGSNAGSFYVMDPSSFSKAERLASQALDEDGRKKVK